jgi:5-methylcytosine-specific restriction enzyme A
MDYTVVEEQHIRREKERARRLRQTTWWMRKTHPGVCHYCHRNVGRQLLTMDHVVPLSRGGKSSKGTSSRHARAVITRKKYLLPIEWEDYLKSLQLEWRLE